MGDKDIMWLTVDDPLAKSVVQAIRTGDVPGLTQLLAGKPGLATARIAGTEEGRASNEGTGSGETSDTGNSNRGLGNAETGGEDVSNTGAGGGKTSEAGTSSVSLGVADSGDAGTNGENTGGGNDCGDAGTNGDNTDGGTNRGDSEANGHNSGDGTTRGDAGANGKNTGGGTDRGMSRTLLHIATDWPGHYPNNAAVVTALIEAGAEVNAQFSGPHSETPLHWAASCDDVEVLDLLLDAGADIEASGAVIAGGTPLDDAVAFAQWRAAQRLVERGAQPALWHAAALGLLDAMEAHFAGHPLPRRYPWGASSASAAPDEINVAFWCACHGGQRAAAECLFARGAELNWPSPWDGLTPLDAANRSHATELASWLESLGAQSAHL
ncbi:ankyrin repeat domain-containing protein [Paenibacillus sp. FSL M7-0896]|uniref:ankyrin repeat domain-containing protein n=1 Tax=Paenibacillus sp. FSL M7-0896 TaxID=2921610 RepID=UPI0030DC6916